MIEIINIEKNFGKMPVLRGLSETIESGSIIALLGPNGSGKTTLLKSILGLVVPDKGDIKIDGRTILKDWHYREKIGYMAQIARMPENLTPSELLQMIAGIRKSPPVFKDELIELLYLGNFLNKPLKTLSGGTRQKVNAVMALMFDTPIIILDEPTVGLDPESSRLLKSFVINEHRRGKTVLFSSHILYDVEELSGELLILIDGTILYRGSQKQLLEKTGATGIEAALACIYKAEEQKHVA